MYRHAVIGLDGYTLTEQEIAWLKHKTPKGVILFARNVQSPEQVKALLNDVRKYGGKHVWAAIDEEGGRVHRMPWAPFHNRIQAADFGALYAQEPEAAIKGVFTDAYKAGQALKALGFTHNCAPVLDVFYPQGHPIIGNRAYAADTEVITTLGKACMFGLLDAGIDAIGKHFPGHGRADADSHVAMPVVDADLDTILAEADAFTRLFKFGLKHVMTAHVSYPNIHHEVGTFSSFWLQTILKEKLGFIGDVWSDDLCMKGTGMDVPSAAAKAFHSGCTVLLVCEAAGVKAFMDACQ
ncbi:MAG: glycoside hydrolase family 3 [Zetaproteobacteria bacterium CG2_30_46_52]|nr:MAG: glycoside hydrolase family 3 [Zetaproteobacteria bacterium CG2_30_46_52]